MDSNPKTAGSILAPEVTQTDMPKFFPNCFLLNLGGKAGYSVYWNTGVGRAPPTEYRTIQRAVCKHQSLLYCKYFQEFLLEEFVWVAQDFGVIELTFLSPRGPLRLPLMPVVQSSIVRKLFFLFQTQSLLIIFLSRCFNFFIFLRYHHAKMVRRGMTVWGEVF